MNKDIIDELKDDWHKQRPELDNEPMGIVLRIQSLAKMLGNQTSERLGEFDLQWWQYDVLSALRRQGSPYVLAASGLAQEAMLTTGAMTNRIDRLEEAGLIKRLRDKSDGRKVLVQLTVRGRKLVDSATEARFEVATKAMAGLDVVQCQQLGDLLRELLLAQTD
jgi:DNA-binding MarR family transcriptional regulator